MNRKLQTEEFTVFSFWYRKKASEPSNSPAAQGLHIRYKPHGQLEFVIRYVVTGQKIPFEPNAKFFFPFRFKQVQAKIPLSET